MPMIVANRILVRVYLAAIRFFTVQIDLIFLFSVHIISTSIYNEMYKFI